MKEKRYICHLKNMTTVSKKIKRCMDMKILMEISTAPMFDINKYSFVGTVVLCEFCNILR